MFNVRERCSRFVLRNFEEAMATAPSLSVNVYENCITAQVQQLWWCIGQQSAKISITTQQVISAYGNLYNRSKQVFGGQQLRCIHQQSAKVSITTQHVILACLKICITATSKLFWSAITATYPLAKCKMSIITEHACNMYENCISMFSGAQQLRCIHQQSAKYQYITTQRVWKLHNRSKHVFWSAVTSTHPSAKCRNVCNHTARQLAPANP